MNVSPLPLNVKTFKELSRVAATLDPMKQHQRPTLALRGLRLSGGIGTLNEERPLGWSRAFLNEHKSGVLIFAYFLLGLRQWSLDFI